MPLLNLATVDDLEEIKRIHYNHFRDEFTLEDFLDPHTLRAWTVRDNDKIVCVGGIRTIVEAVMITDKDLSAEQRRDAFFQMLRSMTYTCNEFGYTQLHAFIQDDKWQRHLSTVGFNPTKGRSLVLNI